MPIVVAVSALWKPDAAPDPREPPVAAQPVETRVEVEIHHVTGTVFHRSQAWGIVIVAVAPHKPKTAASASASAPTKK